MYRPSAVDLTVEGLPRTERALTHACLIAYEHDYVVVSVICYTCPLDLKCELHGLAFVRQNAGHGFPV